MSDFANSPPPQPPIDPAILRQLEETQSQVSRDTQIVAAATQNQAERDRSWIARTIIWIFVGAVAGVLFLLLLRGLYTGDWETVTTQAADILKSAVLPVVTLVLGYYFGQTSKTS